MDNDSKSVSNPIIEETKRLLIDLSNEPKNLKRTMKAVGYISRALETVGIVPILVGGQAVEAYTFGNYTTADVDFVLSGSELAGQVFESLGFDPKSAGHSHWYHKSLELPIEIPSAHLAGSMEKITELDVEGLKVSIIGLEDLILDRLNAGVHWTSNSDMEWAKFLIQSYLDEIDIEYLENESKKPENDVFGAFSKIISELRNKNDGNKNG